MNLSSDAWGALGVILSAISVAVSTIAVARINATKTDVGAATTQASAANDAAVEARELSRPTGNGFAHETTSKLDLILDRLTSIEARHVKTNALIVDHLSDHSRAEIGRHARLTGSEEDD